MLTSKAGSSGSSSGCALAGSDSAGFVSYRGASFCAGGCVGAEVGFCGSGSSGCGADETGFVFSSAGAGCFGSAVSSVPIGFVGDFVTSVCCRVSDTLSAGLSDSAGADGLAGMSPLDSSADVISDEALTEDGLSVISGSGSWLPHPARLRSIRPARRSAYAFLFIIIITSAYKDTGKKPKVQRECHCFEKSHILCSRAVASSASISCTSFSSMCRRCS